MSTVTELYAQYQEEEKLVRDCLTWAEQNSGNIAIETNAHIKLDSRNTKPPRWLELELSRRIDEQALALLYNIITEKIDHLVYLDEQFRLALASKTKDTSSLDELALRAEVLNPASSGEEKPK